MRDTTALRKIQLNRPRPAIIVSGNPSKQSLADFHRLTKNQARLSLISRPSEATIHTQLCNYVRLRYPDVIFTSESAGVRLTMGQAVKAKKLRSSSKLPDFWMPEPRGGYHGLFLEIKRDREEIYTKTGMLRDDKHTQAQAVILDRLAIKNYKAMFACGLDEAIEIVDKYMALGPLAPPYAQITDVADAALEHTRKVHARI